MTTLQNQLLQVSFLGTFRVTTPPQNFFAATFLLFVMNLFEMKRKKLESFEILMFAVELLANLAVVCIVTLCFEHAQHFNNSHIS